MPKKKMKKAKKSLQKKKKNGPMFKYLSGAKRVFANINTNNNNNSCPQKKRQKMSEESDVIFDEMKEIEVEDGIVKKTPS